MSRPMDIGKAPVIDKKDILSIAVDYMQNDIALESFSSEECETEICVPRHCEDVVQGLFGNLKRFRIYGSVAQFVEELMVFQNFPGSHKNFSISATSKYYTVPVIYFSRGRREKFVCKQDLFSILHHLMLKTIPLSQISIIRTLTTVYLKREEDKLGGRIQFAKFSDEELKSIEKELSETQLTYVNHEDRVLKSTFFKDEILEKLHSDFSNYSPVEILTKFTKLVPSIWGVKESERIKKGLESVECFHDREEWLRFVVCSYTNTICILKKFETIIKKRPEMFKGSARYNTQINDSSSESDALSTTSSDSTRPTVRLFEDGPLKYVMRDELLLAVGYTCSCKKDTTKMDFCCEADKKTVPGMLLEEVLRKYRHRIEDIDFIRVPILRTRHRAVPISASFTHQFYVPAVDGLLEILKSMIWGSRIFQRFPVKRKKDLYELFAVIGSLLHCQNDFPFFIQRQELLQITLLCAQKCSFHMKTPLTEIRDVSEDGFTLQMLKEELKYLELTAFLPDVLNHAKRVFQEIDKRKTEEILRTCDMFDAVESCQLISIFNLFPKLKSFLHAQKCCRRIPGLRCETCKEFTSDYTSKEGPATEKFEELGDFCLDAKEMVQKLITNGRYCSSDDDDDDDDDASDSEDEDDDDDDDGSVTYRCANADCPECRKLAAGLEDCGTQTDFCCGGDRELERTKNEVENARVRIEAFEKTLDKITQENLNVMERVKKDLKRKHEEVEAAKRKVKMFDAIQKKCAGIEKKVGEMEAIVKAKEKEAEECKRELTTTTRSLTTKIDSLEKELKKTQKQNETLKTKYSKISGQNLTILEESEELKIRLAETESRELQYKEIYEKMTEKFEEDRAKFSERIAEMGRDLKSEKSRNSVLEAELREAEDIRINTAENVQHRQAEANQMQHHMQIIHESNLNLRTENEMQKRTIQELLRRLEISEEHRRIQMEATNYQNYPPQYHHQNLYHHHDEDPLPSPTKTTKILLPIGAERAANRTPTALKSDDQHNQNPPPPPFPLFYPPAPPPSHAAAAAVGGHQNLVDFPMLNLNLTSSNLETSSSSNPELSDVECLICLSEMQLMDRTIKCSDCRRRFHEKCASDWLKVKSNCPTCTGQLQQEFLPIF